MYLPISIIILSATCIAGLGVLALLLSRTIRRQLALVQYYPDPLMSLDKNSKLISCNKAFADLLGYGSIKECLAFFEEYPHVTKDDHQFIKETVENSLDFPLKFEKPLTLTQRMGGKVERKVELFRTEPNGRSEIRLLTLEPNSKPDDLRLHLISMLDIAAVLQDKHARIVALNAQAKVSMTQRIGDSFVNSSNEQQHWIHIALKGHTHHKVSVLLNVPEQLPLIKERISRAQGFDESPKQLERLDSLSGVAGILLIDLEDGTLEPSQELVNALEYRDVENTRSSEFWWNCIANADKPRIIESFEDYEAGRSSELRVTFRIADSRGAEHYIEVRGKVTHRNELGKLVSLAGTTRLLTPQKTGTLEDEEPKFEVGLSPRSRDEAVNNTGRRVTPSKLQQHDLANHIGVVTGYADLVLADTSLSEETRSFVEAIATAGNEAQGCLGGQGKTEPNKSPIVDSKTEEKPWATQFNEGLDRLTLILTSYFDAEATRDGEIKIRDYIVDTNPDYCGFCGDLIELGSHAREVFDNRVRIDHHSLPYVTNPAFYGASNNGSPNLAELARILHQQNGHMSLLADSTGVNVTIYTLPKSVTLKTSLKPRILVVDDEELVSSYFAIVLGRAGYEVTTLNQPQLALRYLNRDHQPCDLLITDQNMPGMTGEELCYSIRKKHPDLPIILCTGYNSLQRKPLQSNLLSQTGVIGVLKKPLDAQELLEVVRELIVLAPNRRQRN
jgi:CheY-like chemotaxis protein